jgi:hypothetical protein
MQSACIAPPMHVWGSATRVIAPRSRTPPHARERTDNRQRSPARYRARDERRHRAGRGRRSMSSASLRGGLVDESTPRRSSVPAIQKPVRSTTTGGTDSTARHENRPGLGPGPRRSDSPHSPRPIPARPRVRCRGLAARARRQEHRRHTSRADSRAAPPSRLTASPRNDPGKPPVECRPETSLIKVWTRFGPRGALLDSA